MFIVYGIFMIFIGVAILVATIRSGKTLDRVFNSLFSWLEDKLR